LTKKMPNQRTWSVDHTSEPQVVRCTLTGIIRADEMAEFVVAHNRAIDAMQGQEYRVWVDLRGLAALSPEATKLMEQAKRYSAGRPNFQGSAVLVSSGGAVAALQHRRTSVGGGVIDTEFTSDDEQECLRHLATVKRTMTKVASR
jgi:hypothetical protein